MRFCLQGTPPESTYGVGSSRIIVATLHLVREGGLREQVTMSGNVFQQRLPAIEVKVGLVAIECFEVSSVDQCGSRAFWPEDGSCLEAQEARRCGKTDTRDYVPKIGIHPGD